MDTYIAAYTGGKYLVLELNNGVYRDFATMASHSDMKLAAAALNGAVSA